MGQAGTGGRGPQDMGLVLPQGSVLLVLQPSLSVEHEPEGGPQLCLKRQVGLSGLGTEVLDPMGQAWHAQGRPGKLTWRSVGMEPVR